MKFENLNLDMFGLVGLGLSEFGAKNVEIIQKNAMVLKGI